MAQPPSSHEMDAPASVARVSVLLPMPFAGAFDYVAPAPMALQPGDIVTVPLGRRFETGVVWDATPDLPPDLAYATDTKPVPASRLRPVSARLDLPPLNAELRRFVNWVAAYTLSPPGMVLAMTLRQ
ncbi:primosomal protein N' family DNA-binding protein, partial [Acetobacter papayae]